MRRKRAAKRASTGAAIPVSDRKAIAAKLKRTAALLKATKPAKKTAKKSPPAKKKPAKKKKTTTKAKPKDRAVKDRAIGGKVVGRIAPKGKAKTPPAVPMLGMQVPSGPVDPVDIIRAALNNAAAFVLGGDPFSLHDSKQVIGIVRDALETIAVVDSHRPPAQVEAEMTQFLEVALDFVPPKRRKDFNTAFQKALKAAT